MKILIVTSSVKTFKYILKGQPKYLNQYFSIIVGSNNFLSIKKFANEENVRFSHIPMYRKINPIYDVYSIIVMVFQILKFKPDVVHSYTPKAGLICAISGYITKVPIRIHTFTGLIFPYRKFLMKTLLAKIDSIICELNTHIIAEGVGVKKQLIDNKITNQPINIIGNGNIAGVDTFYYNPEEKLESFNRIEFLEKLNITEKTLIFIYAGRLNQDKGIVELLQAYVELDKKDVCLLLVGEFETRIFENRVKKLMNNSDNLIYIEGWKDDIRPYLYLSDCFVLPSYREGFPNVLLQAGAMMLPSIVTNIPGSNEIIRNNYNGWICNSKSSSELGDLMNFVTSISKVQLASYGIKARQHIKGNYEKHEYQNNLVKFYKGLNVD
jgi:glycosyltransferase involved in cell wall biosynthesis